MIQRFMLILVVTSYSNIAHAESFLCRKLNVGCYSQQERDKAFQRCLDLGNEAYQNALIESLSNPLLWQLNGNDSAQDYARMRKRSMMNNCIKSSPVLSD